MGSSWSNGRRAGASHHLTPTTVAASKLQRPQAEVPIRRPQAAPNPVLTAEDRELLTQLDGLHWEFLDAAEYIDGHSRFTIALYKQTWGNFRRFLLDREACKELRVTAKLQLLDQWSGWNRKRGISPITVNSYWRMLRPFLNYLEKTEGTTNPYRTSKAPKFQQPDPKALKPEDLRRVLAGARNYPWRTRFQRSRAVALVGVMAFAGLRRSEALQLEYEDVNLDDGTIRVKRGKGRHGGKPRTAYMLPELLPILREYRDERRAVRYAPPEYFATGASTGLSLTQLRRIMRMIRDATGVKFTPHSLRHSYVTLLVRNRVPLHIVQAFAGHADVQTTQRYVRVFDEDLQRYARRVRLQ